MLGTVHHAVDDPIEMGRDRRPSVVLFHELPGGAAKLCATLRIAEELDHTIGEIGGIIGQNDIFAVGDGQTLGAHGG
jgi:hypothetical protein